jgi:hypothetical protein
MKKIDFGQSLTILANLGVIAGIVFLGYELQQNQVVVQAQTRNDITRMFVDTSRADISSEMIEIVTRKLNGAELSETDERRIGIWADIWLTLFENMEYHRRQGLYQQEEYEAQYRELDMWINSTDPFRDRFCEYRFEYTVSFQNVIDGMLEHPCG